MSTSHRLASIVSAFLLSYFVASPPSCAAQQMQRPATETIRQTVTFIEVNFTKDGKAWHSDGTGFFVAYEDSRLPAGRAFTYLVTNRHVAEPGVEDGHEYPVTSTHIRMNLRQEANGEFSKDLPLPVNGSIHWYFPEDKAVDLAVLPMGVNPDIYEYVAFPVSFFVTKEVIMTRQITEGDSVLFAGYFRQFPGLERFEPIVRQGVLAMMPREPMQTTLNKPGLLYLADLHVFNGNSGSPLYVNIGAVRNGTLTVGGFPYLLIGVVSGYYYEDSNLKLTVTTKTVTGKLGANSGIALVVPADQIKTLLDSSPLQILRDSGVAQISSK